MNKLAKHIFVILITILTSHTAFAQDGSGYFRQHRNSDKGHRAQNPGMKRIQAVKEGFLSRQLNLKPEQAEKFWPIYRQYQQELFEVRRLKRLNNSDAQANGAEQIRKDLEYESQLVNIKKHYNDEFLKVLPPDKVSELYKSERQFTDELIKQIHEHNNDKTE